MCSGACAYRLICATSAQPAQGCSPFEKWVTLPDDVKSPSASPVCGALPKPPHPIPRPYNGKKKFSSKAFIKHLPRISQLLNLNTLTTLGRRKPDQTVKKLSAFKASSKMAQRTEILWGKKSRSKRNRHCDRRSDAPKLPPALKADI